MKGVFLTYETINSSWLHVLTDMSLWIVHSLMIINTHKWQINMSRRSSLRKNGCSICLTKLLEFQPFYPCPPPCSLLVKEECKSNGQLALYERVCIYLQVFSRSFVERIGGREWESEQRGWLECVTEKCDRREWARSRRTQQMLLSCRAWI